MLAELLLACRRWRVVLRVLRDGGMGGATERLVHDSTPAGVAGVTEVIEAAADGPRHSAPAMRRFLSAESVAISTRQPATVGQAIRCM